MISRFTIILSALALLAGCNSKNTKPGEPTPIRISNPSNGATLTDPLTVSAAPGDGYTFTRVDFYIDGDSVWSDNISPYQYYWNIFIYPANSQHILWAVGHTADTSYVSATVTVNVVIIHGFAYLSSYQPNSQQATGVTNYQNVMFVATGDPGLEVIDISDKGAPHYLSRFDSFGLALKADVMFPYVFVADRDDGALRLDFSNVDSLVLTGYYDTPGLANDVAVSGNYLYIADQDGLAIADISQSDTVVAINRVSLTAGEVNYVVARGDTAYVTDVTNLYIIDLTDPYTPDILATFNTPGQAQGVAIADTFVFVADGVEGIIALSVNHPTAPLATYGFQQAVSTVDVGDSTLFAGTFGGGVFAFDYSQPDTLKNVDQFTTQDLIWQVHSSPPYLYVATNSNVTLLRYVR